MNIWKKFAQGGGFSLPYLVKIANPDGGDALYLINDSISLEYGGNTYKPSQFEYTPNDTAEGTFNIELAEHDEIIDLLENYYELNIEVIGVLNGDEVVELASWRHKYGTATWDGAKLEITLDQDDRLEMTFPALLFNSYNNRGNT